MVTTLYAVYNILWEDVRVCTEEPTWNKFVGVWDPQGRVTNMCFKEAKKLFPKLKKKKDEFLTFTVKEGDVWGPAE